MDLFLLKKTLDLWALELGFGKIRVARLETHRASAFLKEWLNQGYHGEMDYMARNLDLRADPSLMVPRALTALSLRLDYLPLPLEAARNRLDRTDEAAISVYALGRDYHKLMRRRLLELTSRMQKRIGPFGYRVFADSAPVFEKSLAESSGVGWIGKHTNLIDRQAGSFFFLGEVVTDLPLPVDDPVTGHCGSCTACLSACPTQAIVAPYQLDARLCISYLTIEYSGSIPLELRPLIGNRVYGCDDCQLVCPWNRYAALTKEKDFLPRHGFDRADLTVLFGWSEEEFLSRLQGSAIRRIGHVNWLRNLAVGLGNAPRSESVIKSLEARLNHPSELVLEHVRWALSQHQASGS